MRRFLCVVLGHRYVKVPYPDSPTDYFARCRRCGHEKEVPSGLRPPSAPGGSMAGTV